MRLKNVLLVVADMEKSKAFYQELFELIVVKDFGENVILTSGLVLQEKTQWEQLLHEETIAGNATELFFEERAFERFLQKIKEKKIKEVSEPVINSWGKRCVRIEDPDGHLIEIAEEIDQMQ